MTTAKLSRVENQLLTISNLSDGIKNALDIVKQLQPDGDEQLERLQEELEALEGDLIRLRHLVTEK